MEISQINFVSNLSWNCINKECLICNNSIGNNCIKCEEKPNCMGCMSIMNNNTECKHSFHAHCLQLYHKSNKLKCPMCNYAWLG
jgi:hypothetical protein